MKIAHFVQFGPHQCGQYETVKDMIKGEREAGLEAEIIDYGLGGGQCRVGYQDGHIKTVHPDYAKEADVLFRHSAIPGSILRNGKPVVMCMHGRPESTFKIGHNQGSDKKTLIKIMLDAAKNSQYRALVTFWDEYIPIWKNIIPEKEKIRFIPAPVDLDFYKPNGNQHKLPVAGIPQLMIADLWREDITPFNLIFAAIHFQQNYCPTAVINLYGLPSSKYQDFLECMRNRRLFGDFYTQVNGLERMYRAMDIYLTPHTIAVRTVREALASGISVVGGTGNQFTEFQWDSNDMVGYALEIHRTWNIIQEDREMFKANARKTAIENFHPLHTGLSIRKMLEEVL